MHDIKEQVEALIQEAEITMISSVDEEGYPSIKAINPPRKREGYRQMYFLTRNSSMRVQHYAKNPRASIYFYNEASKEGLMLKGSMETLYDQDLIDELWCNGDEERFVHHQAFPDCSALKFTAFCGRYFDGERTEVFAIGIDG